MPAPQYTLDDVIRIIGSMPPRAELMKNALKARGLTDPEVDAEFQKTVSAGEGAIATLAAEGQEVWRQEVQAIADKQYARSNEGKAEQAQIIRTIQAARAQGIADARTLNSTRGDLPPDAMDELSDDEHLALAGITVPTLPVTGTRGGFGPKRVTSRDGNSSMLVFPDDETTTLAPGDQA